jgi:hypothetical protein
MTDPNGVLIFDTTLRDGERSPGCSMTQPEKLRVAKALAELGVNVIEAGFPITSRGDWESVNLGGWILYLADRNNGRHPSLGVTCDKAF